MQNLEPLGVAGQAAHLALAISRRRQERRKIRPAWRYSIKVFRRCWKHRCRDCSQAALCARARHQARRRGSIEPLAAFTTNPAGSAIVNAVGPIRQIVENTDRSERRYLVIVAGTTDKLGALVQVQAQ